MYRYEYNCITYLWMVLRFLRLYSLARMKTTVLWRYLPHGCTWHKVTMLLVQVCATRMHRSQSQNVTGASICNTDTPGTKSECYWCKYLPHKCTWHKVTMILVQVSATWKHLARGTMLLLQVSATRTHLTQSYNDTGASICHTDAPDKKSQCH